MKLQYYILNLMTDYMMLRHYTSLLQTISTETAVKSPWCGPLIWTWVYTVHILAELELNLLLMKSLTWTCISKCEMRTLSLLPKRKLHLLQRHLYILAYIQNFTVYGIYSTRHNIKKVYENFDFLPFCPEAEFLDEIQTKGLKVFLLVVVTSTALLAIYITSNSRSI